MNGSKIKPLFLTKMTNILGFIHGHFGRIIFDFQPHLGIFFAAILNQFKVWSHFHNFVIWNIHKFSLYEPEFIFDWVDITKIKNSFSQNSQNWFINNTKYFLSLWHRNCWPWTLRYPRYESGGSLEYIIESNWAFPFFIFFGRLVSIQNWPIIYSERFDDCPARKIWQPCSWKNVFQSQHAPVTVEKENQSWYSDQSCSIFIRDRRHFAKCQNGHYCQRSCWTICLVLWIFSSFRNWIMAKAGLRLYSKIL